MLNNKILGFGHYYKCTYCKQDFDDLGAFIRQRLRRYISRYKDSRNKLGNLILTNQALESMGLKSLADIYLKYVSKKKVNFPQNKKKDIKTSKTKNLYPIAQLEEKELQYLIKLIFKEVKETNQKLKTMEYNIRKIEKKTGETKIRDLKVN